MFDYKISGDSALIVSAGDEISETINSNVRKMLLAAGRKNIPGVIDFIPSYTELMVCYDPLVIDYTGLLSDLQRIEIEIDSVELPGSSVFEIPVLYGGISGPDLDEVAHLNKLTKDEVVNIHTSGCYPVYMLGFTPGFCYLGGLDKRIHAPRKRDPRINIQAGSVGIAGNQTGIYPIESPGGWQLIGKTPVRLFDPGRKPEFLIDAGDYIKFYPVDKNEFENILQDVDRGIFKVKITKKS